VVDTGTYEVTETIPLQSIPSYITPDPNGKCVYASVQAGLQVIDTSSLQVVDTPHGRSHGNPPRAQVEARLEDEPTDRRRFIAGFGGLTVA
jgi:DNA-binding beta-propeller fold protein YncE